MPENVMSAINSVFCAGCCDDEGTKETIKKTFEDYGYLCDTHTAVGINVYEKYAEKTGDKTPTVIDSTANPFKFSRSVLDAVEPGASEGLDEFSMVGELAHVTKTSCPPQLADLRDKPVRFRDSATGTAWRRLFSDCSVYDAGRSPCSAAAVLLRVVELKCCAQRVLA